MHDLPPLIEYPVFRLVCSMAFGIFISDLLSTGIGENSTYSQATLSLLFEVMLLVLSFVLVAMFLSYYSNQLRFLPFLKRTSYQAGKKPYANKLPSSTFGVLVSIAFFLFGCIRYIQEKQQVDFEWNNERNIYVGQLLDSPIQKGKMSQAEVIVSFEAVRKQMERTVGNRQLNKKEPISVRPIYRHILLSWMPDSLQSPLQRGDYLLFASSIHIPYSDIELTGFDYATYLHRKGISGIGIAFQGDWMRITTPNTNEIFGKSNNSTFEKLKQLALNCRDYIVSCFRKWNLGTNEFAVVSALTIGDKSALTPSLKGIYSAAGVSHVLALSGLHVGILSAILYFILAPFKRVRHGEIVRSMIVTLVLWFFAFVSGLSPSVVRAVTMCTLYLIAHMLIEGRFPSIYVLVLAAFLMLIYQPLYLFDVGFQLSFLAVASILYFYPLVSGWLTVKNNLLRWVWNAISVSVSAQFGTLPLILYYFGTFPTYFLVANLLVSVLAVGVLCNTIAAFLFMNVPIVGEWLVKGVRFSTYCMNTSIQWVQDLTGSQLGGLSISALQSFCGFVFLYGLYLFIRKKRVFHLLCILLSLNISLVDWMIVPLLNSHPTIHLYRKQVFIKQYNQVKTLISPTGMYEIDSLRIALITTNRWKNKETIPCIPIDYLYICRGSQGNLKSLLRTFQTKHVILDTSLSQSYREMLQQECEEMKLPYAYVSEKRSYTIGKTF